MTGVQTCALPICKKARITVVRDRKELKLDVRIGTHPDSDSPPAQDRDNISEKLDFQIQDLSPSLAERFGYEEDQGVIVTRVTPGSDAAEKGLRPGVLIMEVNRRTVRNTDAFYSALQKAESGSSILLLLKYGKNVWFATVKLK